MNRFFCKVLPLYPHRVWIADKPMDQDFEHFWTWALRTSSKSPLGFSKIQLIWPLWNPMWTVSLQKCSNSISMKYLCSSISNLFALIKHTGIRIECIAFHNIPDLKHIINITHYYTFLVCPDVLPWHCELRLLLWHTESCASVVNLCSPLLHHLLGHVEGWATRSHHGGSWTRSWLWQLKWMNLLSQKQDLTHEPPMIKLIETSHHRETHNSND